MAASLFILAAVGAALAATVGIAGVLGTGGRLSIPWLVPLGGLELSLDPLGGLFLALVGAAAIPASIYAIGYAGGERRGVLAYLGFVSAMSVVPLAANLMTFVIAWELMSLASYFLVLHDRDRTESVDAAWVYAVMSQIGLACLLAGMLVLATATGSTTFADWSSAAPDLPPGTRVLPLVLLGLGFASKAGVIPLHVWLPRAHPAAPSHVSALMSGVMIKLGIYGLARVSLDWLGAHARRGGAPPCCWSAPSPPSSASSTRSSSATSSACSPSRSIENVGIILIGLGAGLVFAAVGLGGLAVLAIAAALYHAVNHAAFKSLLFLGAGAVVHATGTRNMNALGGLVRRMPWTAACFLVGAVAIAALPPLNGFVSEWLIFQALLQNVRMARLELNLAFTVGLAALALTSGLALACFVKAAGITFLAVPRSEAAARRPRGAGVDARRHGPARRGVRGPRRRADAGAARAGPSGRSARRLRTARPGRRAHRADLRRVRRAVAARPGRPRSPLRSWRRWARCGSSAPSAGRGGPATWACGRILQTARMEYTATAFSNPFKRVFDFFYRPAPRLDIEFHPESRFFVERIEYASPTRSLVEEWLYRPALATLSGLAAHARRLQSGSANTYLAYILAALVLLLVIA